MVEGGDEPPAPAIKRVQNKTKQKQIQKRQQAYRSALGGSRAAMSQGMLECSHAASAVSPHRRPSTCGRMKTAFDLMRMRRRRRIIIMIIVIIMITPQAPSPRTAGPPPAGIYENDRL